MHTIQCDDFRRFIDPYLDGEFDETERAAFDAHLAGCSDCRAHFEQKAWMQQAIAPALKRPCHMPQAARDRLNRTLRAAERPARIRRAARRVAAPLSTVAAVGAVLLLVTPLTGFKPTVIEDAVALHQQEVPVELPTPIEREMEAWFDGKVPFELNAPRFKDARVTLLGGRLSRIGPVDDARGRQAAYLVYGVGKHKMTVMVFDGRGLDLEVPDMHLKGTPLHFHDVDGYRVTLFQKGALAYAVTSDLPPAEMLNIIETTL